MRVLLVNNNVNDLHDVEDALRIRGITVETTDTGDSAIYLAKNYDYDTVLINMNLRDINANEVLRRLRSNGTNTPIIITADISTSAYRIQSLESGADDFISGPVDDAEVVARVFAVVRRSNGFSHSVIRVGNIQLDLNDRTLVVDKKHVHLTGKEFAAISLLFMRSGKIVSKETFMNHIYGGIDEPEIKIIDVFICKLRRKLALAGARECIETVWGAGYIIRTGGFSDGFDVGSLHDLLVLDAA